MFKIYDGRTEFYQWDLDQKLIVSDPAIDEVHFCNQTDDCSLVCEVYEEEGHRLVNVPNILLQNNYPIKAYAYCGCMTKTVYTFKVLMRSKPADYVYQETEVRTWEKLNERITELELGNCAITDVEVLPTENILPRLLYRTPEGVYWFADGWHKVVDTAALDLAISAEEKRAKEAEKTNADNLDTHIENYDAKVKALEGADATNTKAIADEETRAKGVEQALDKKITDEIARQDEDIANAIQTANEAKTTADTLDNTIQSALSLNEETRRLLRAEEERAEGEEKRIENRLDTHINETYTPKIAELDGAIKLEEARAKSEEQKNATAIANEETRAKREEGLINTALEAHKTAYAKKIEAIEAFNTQDAQNLASHISTYNEQVHTFEVADKKLSDALDDFIEEVRTILQITEEGDEAFARLQQVINYAQSNKALIDEITTSKVSVSDIVDHLLSLETAKPLSANQGRILKELIDAFRNDYNETVTNVGSVITQLATAINTEKTRAETAEASLDERVKENNALAQNAISTATEANNRSQTSVQQKPFTKNVYIPDFDEEGDTARAYVRNRNNAEDSIVVSTEPKQYAIPIRNENGNLLTNTPTIDNESANKKYVDDEITKETTRAINAEYQKVTRRPFTTVVNKPEYDNDGEGCARAYVVLNRGKVPDREDAFYSSDDTILLSKHTIGNAIPLRDEDGHLLTPDPSENGDNEATNKRYVDDSISAEVTKLKEELQDGTITVGSAFADENGKNIADTFYELERNKENKGEITTTDNKVMRLFVNTVEAFEDLEDKSNTIAFFTNDPHIAMLNTMAEGIEANAKAISDEASRAKGEEAKAVHQTTFSTEHSLSDNNFNDGDCARAYVRLLTKTNDDGTFESEEGSLLVSRYTKAYAIALRDSAGNLFTLTPTDKNHCANKQYVDGEVTKITDGTTVAGKAQEDANGNVITSTYAKASQLTSAMQSIANGNTVVGRATSDADGNNIADTYAKAIDLNNLEAATGAIRIDLQNGKLIAKNAESASELSTSVETLYFGSSVKTLTVGKLYVISFNIQNLSTTDTVFLFVTDKGTTTSTTSASGVVVKYSYSTGEFTKEVPTGVVTSSSFNIREI